MGWQRAVPFLILWAVIGVKKTEGIIEQNHLKFSSKRNGMENSIQRFFNLQDSCHVHPILARMELNASRIHWAMPDASK